MRISDWSSDVCSSDLRSTLTEPASRVERGLAVSLHNVSFSHGNADAAVTALNQVSLEIPAGAFVAVTGPVGSGKSALAQALLGLYPLAGGTVSLDGDAPARHRGDLGHLPQDPFLFSRSEERPFG